MRIQLFSLASGLAFLVAAAAHAANVEVTLRDQLGKPVRDAIVSLKPLDAPGADAAAGEAVVVDQVGREFEPHITAVRAGGSVIFKNSDPFGHQVFSFSETKHFELRQDGNTVGEPMPFETPGVVPLGCNIHDNMLAYLYVVDAPYFEQSGRRGPVVFEGVPAGRYRVEVWHPLMRGEVADSAREVELAGDDVRITVQLTMRPPPQRREPAGTSTRSGYRG